jgi:4-amino-4-deoxy-L-arabinose transferase-like glycosyltransferase
MEKFEKPFVQFYLIPFVIFAVAFLLRAAWIGIHMGQDEVYYVGYASDLLHGKSFANVFPPFFEMVLVPVLWLSGESEVVVHIFMAFLGALSVLFVYLIGRKFFNAWVGIIGAILLMFNTTHWFFSAFGMLDVPATLFATSAIYFLWSGYVERNKKMLLVGSLLNVAAVFTRYTIFPSAALFGYWLLFDRRSLRNKQLLLAVLLPFIVWGMWMFYFITQVGWLWNWWLQYVTGQLSINVPWYFYFQAVRFEFLGQILSVFAIFTSLFLLFSKPKMLGEKWKRGFNYLFLVLFVCTAYYFSQQIFLQPTQEAAIGLLAVALPALYFFNLSDIRKIFSKKIKLERPDFKKFLVLLIAAVFLFYSPLGVKFPRYVMSSLPAIYLFIGMLIYEIRSYKIYLLIYVIVLSLFVFANAEDTINKLVVDKTINEVKFTAQKYVNDNSQQCSQVYSKTWYGFYYLRNRVTDLPGDANSLKNIIKSSCKCPPKFFIVEGLLDNKFSNVTTKEKSFQQNSVSYTATWQGIKTETAFIAPVDVYRINDNFIKEACPTV